MRTAPWISMVSLGVGLLARSALGHVPVFSDGSAAGPDAAIQVEDVTISRVVYHEATASAPQVWVAFEARAGQDVSFRLGVPYIERLSAFRPALAVLGPGLPAVDLPFAVPQGLGGAVLEPPAGELEFFHEEFTGTDSWIVGDLDVNFPQDGRCYVVAYVPSGEFGKLWAAMGDREVFGPDDIANFGNIVNRVRAFHEIPESPYPCFVPLLGALGLSAIVVGLLRRRQAWGK